MNIEQIAKICHQANKIFCEFIGDTSQVNWENAPLWQRESAIKGVQYHMQNPTSKPSDSHESWLKEKNEKGWVYGSVKSEEDKIHPCIVPFDELPKDQQFKDILFSAIVKSFFK